MVPGAPAPGANEPRPSNERRQLPSMETAARDADGRAAIGPLKADAEATRVATTNV